MSDIQSKHNPQEEENNRRKMRNDTNDSAEKDIKRHNNCKSKCLKAENRWSILNGNTF